MTNYRNPPQKSDQNPEEDPKIEKFDPRYGRGNMGQSSSHGSLPHNTPTNPVGKFVRFDIGETLRQKKPFDPTNPSGSTVSLSSSGSLPEEEPQFGQEERAKVLKKKYDKSKKLNPQERLD